jgi:protein SCO1/2
MRYFILIIFSALFFTGCPRQGAQPQNASDTAKRYNLKGKVVSVDRAAKKATIDHGDIPGYMPPMTMEFPVRADWVWDDLTPGAEIRAELVVDNAKGEYWLENLGIMSASNPGQPGQPAPPPADERFAQIGKEVPDFSLLNQDGKRISMKDFRGKALAITFIYAQCPLPDYCIKMSTNFSDLANQVKGDPDLKDKLRLLSISFDPARDTPAKLKQYGAGYYGKDVQPDFNLWQLAVGKDAEVKKIADFFGLRYEVDENDKTQLNHSLRTAVIAPDGKVTKIFSGNDWTANDLLREMEFTLK